MRVFIRMYGQIDWAGWRTTVGFFPWLWPKVQRKWCWVSVSPSGSCCLVWKPHHKWCPSAPCSWAQTVSAGMWWSVQAMKGNINHKTMKKVIALLKKDSRQSEDGCVCIWIFFLGQRHFLCKWRAAQSDPLSLPPEGLAYEIVVPGSCWYTGHCEPFASPSLSVVPCSIPCQHPLVPLGQWLAVLSLPWDSPAGLGGRELQLWSALKLGAAAGAAHGAAWEKLSFRSGVHEQARVRAVWVPALPFPVKSMLQL